MNCKIGDIAIVIGTSVRAGKIVEIIGVPHSECFYLPNGVRHCGVTETDFWVLRSLGTPFEGAHGDGMYASGCDRGLLPIGKSSLRESESVDAMKSDACEGH